MKEINVKEEQNTWVDYILSVVVAILFVIILSIGLVLFITIKDSNVKGDNISTTECIVTYSSDCSQSRFMNLNLYRGKDLVNLFSTKKENYTYLKVNDTLYKVNIQQVIPEGNLTGVLLKYKNTTRIYFGKVTDPTIMWRSGYIATCK